MEQTIKSLVNIGLTQTEAQIYLAGLGQDSIGVQEIAKKTRIKRPTIYHAVKTLLDKGIVAERKIGGKSLFVMSSPETLKSYVHRQKQKLEKQELAIDELIPFLTKQTNGDDSAIQTVEYQGIEGVKTVFEEALYCKDRHWDIIAPVNNFLREYNKDYAANYLKTRARRDITVRTLWEHKPNSRKLTPMEIRDRNPRFMPESMQGRFNSMIILFDDKIAIIAPFSKLSAILITSKELKNMFTALFGTIWSISEKYE